MSKVVVHGNQKSSVYVGDCVKSIKRSTKKKPAEITLVIPDDLCEEIISRLVMTYSPTIVDLRLTWIDKNR